MSTSFVKSINLEGPKAFVVTGAELWDGSSVAGVLLQPATSSKAATCAKLKRLSFIAVVNVMHLCSVARLTQR
jgi:hypothetical protein